MQDGVSHQSVMEAKDQVLKDSLQDSRRRAQLLDAVLEAIDVGVVVVAKDGHIMLLNSRQLASHELAQPAGDGQGGGQDEGELFIFEPDGHTDIPSAERPLARSMRRESFTGSLISVGRAPDQRAMAVSARPLAG